MTAKKHSFFKIAICVILAIMLFPVAKIGTLFADTTETITVSKLVSDYIDGKEKDQEITSSLGINTNFGEGYGYATTDGWSIPTYKGVTITQVNAGDFTSEATIGYAETNDIKFNAIGTDGIAGNKYGLLFMLKEAGVAGIESPSITIPANAYYVLTFNVKVSKLASGTVGINAKIVEEDGTITSLDAIKSTTTSYKTYAFLLQGNENVSKTVKLQLLFGNVAEKTDTEEEEKEYDAKTQVGYAAVDTVRMFSLSQSQFASISSDKSGKKVSLLSQNSSYVSVPNGYFNETDNQKWQLNENTALSDLKPLNWKQESGQNASYGVVNTNDTLFNNRLTAAGITAVNPGNASGKATSTGYNNVLMLNNSDASYQTITSDQFTLAKNSYYKVSFEFNTPATENQTNKISFYVVDADGKTIYSKENMVSYTEYNGKNNEWAKFNLFIEMSDTEKKVNFVIKFGTENATAKGVAYVDAVSFTKVTSATLAFDNTQENKYVLKGEEGSETEYLKTGEISFEDLSKLDQTHSSNNSLAYHSYKVVAAEETEKENTTDKNETTAEESGFNQSMLWYVIPSVLLGVCLIAGLILYYVKKIKIKKPKKKPKKAAYDRKQTLNKQIEKREKAGNTVNKEELEKQLQNVEKEIEELEKAHALEKQNKYTRQKYQAKLENLQTKQQNIKNQLEK